MASVSLVDLKKYYRTSREDVLAVEEMNLEIVNGEFLVLLGPSGCGKSTTMRMIAGLEKISAGEIRIGERRVNDLTPSERNIAMAFETYALYTHLTAAENLGFCLRARKLPAADIHARVQKVAQMLHLEGILDQRPSALSGGHQQRLSLGRALIRNPDVFLLDEPLSHLDAKLRVQIRAEIRWLHRELKTTMIYVTHDQIEALALADRIAIMNFGALQQVGTPDEVFDRPTNRFVATFLGEPTMNIIDGTLVTESDAAFVQCGESGWRLPVSADRAMKIEKSQGAPKISIGIRPQDVALVSESSMGDPAAGTVRGIVKVIEFLGEKYVVTTRMGESEIVSCHDSIDGLQEGAQAALHLDPRKLHYFERRTGNSIH